MDKDHKKQLKVIRNRVKALNEAIRLLVSMEIELEETEKAGYAKAIQVLKGIRLGYERDFVDPIRYQAKNND